MSDSQSAAAFVHLRLHSEYDIQKGVARISGDDSIVDYAAELQQPALALTDGGCLFGAVKFYERCRKKGIKPIIGCELKVDEQNEHHLLLLCASHSGYINLNRLLSRTYSEGSCARAEWMTPESTEGIIALSGGGRGDIGAAIERARLDAAEKCAREWMARFPDRFYIEVWRGNQQDNNRATAAADIGQRLGLPVVATHPVQCARPKDEDVLNVKLCIAAGQRLFDPQRPQPLSDQPHLLSAADMRVRFADMPGALENSAEIAKRCNFSFRFGGIHLPTLPQKEAQSSAAFLRQEAEAGLAGKLSAAAAAATQQEEYRQRLDYELEMIGKMEFADYFLIVMDFVRWAKQNGIPVGPGRGSGAGSLVAYALDITTLDPLEYELLFERFLNPERISMPDFDVDFCVNGRDQVIRYVEERYGRERVTQIVTFGTIGAKGAVRDVGRVLGMPYGYCDRLARMIPDGLKMSIAKALEESADFAEQRREEDGKRLIDLALKVEGLARNIGTHAGGVLIAPRPLEEFCPRYAAMDTDTLVSQYDMLDIEKIGLVKFDFLGLRTLTILADAEREVRRQHQPDFVLEQLPLDDNATYELYSSGDTIGVFQCESPGMRELMKQLRPDCFTDLIALVALYRPGPLNADMDKSYIARKHGREEVSYPHELLKPVLADTYGLFIYQEQVMEIARRIGGYSLGEADILRRAMGKKDEKAMASMRTRFVEGSTDVLPKAAAQKLFKDMAQFAEYGFNKSHAAAYALLSYRTAYIKAHYRAVFFAAVLSAEADSSERVQLLAKDARHFKIIIASPDINSNVADFRAIDAHTIQFGLKAIKGVGSGVIQQIIDIRGETPFRDLFDFCTRAAGSIPAAALELLAQAGTFDSLHASRAAVKMTLPSVLAQNINTGNLFANTDAGGEALAETPEWTLREKLLHERQAIGFPFSASYYDLYSDIVGQLPLRWQRLADASSEDDITLAGNLLRVRRRARQKGGVFIMGDGEDEVEVLAPRELMKALSGDEINAELLVIRGRAFSSYRGGISISAKAIYRLDEFLASQLRQVTIKCTPALAAATLQQLLPRQPSGKQRVLLRCQDNGIVYEINLGNGWTLNHSAYQRLLATRGVERVNLEF